MKRPWIILTPVERDPDYAPPHIDWAMPSGDIIPENELGTWITEQVSHGARIKLTTEGA